MKIFDIHSKKKLQLVRWGGLSPIKQRHFVSENCEDKSFHNPPERYGFYAFPYCLVEDFLLGYDPENKERKINKSTGEKYFLNYRKQYKRFEVDGVVWVHIADDFPEFVLETKGSWQLIHSSDYKIILKKFIIMERRGLTDVDTHPSFKGILVYGDFFKLKNPHEYFSKDHYEIFIPSKTKVYGKTVKEICDIDEEEEE